MSLAYHAVGWNRQKRIYDLTLGGLLIFTLALYAATVWSFHPATTAETFIIRFTSISALVLLHVILAIGPLSRLDSRFLPLLYNRRHLGVTMFLFALVHGVFATIQFHAGGDRNPLVSVLTAYRREYLSGFSNVYNIAHFPFESLGLAALGILFLMAATSHDFWLKNLGPSFWKILHMFVYAAYGLILAHVFLGAFQSERSPLFPVILGGGFLALATLHLAAFAKERRTDLARQKAKNDGFVQVATLEELTLDCGKVVVAGGQRIALFLHDGKIFAISNVCRHQGGPLGEGRMVKGCLTCPWHGYQYHVEDGCSPPPFKEVAPTYPIRIIQSDIFVSPAPLPLGTRSEGAMSPAVSSRQAIGDFYIGWLSRAPASHRKFLGGRIAVLAGTLGILFFAIARFQNPVDAGAFEFGVQRSFEGVLYESPLPLLQIGGGVNFLLVGAGKFGPPDAIKGHDGQRVKFSGSLIHRHGVPMIELNRPETFQSFESPPKPPSTVVSLGQGTFTGELVDTKCFLGVMRPATGKIHRACAVRCLSGGAPPGLLIRDGEGNATVLMLAGEEGKPFSIDPELAAKELEVRGTLEIHNGTPILRTSAWKLTN